MELEHLNYCRQLTKYARSLIAVPSIPRDGGAKLTAILDLCAVSQKFILPDGGFAIRDTELRGLDESLELRLPSAAVALEYRTVPGDPERNVSGMVLFAREWDDCIVVTGAVKLVANQEWGYLEGWKIPRIGWMRRTDESETGIGLVAEKMGDGELPMRSLVIVLSLLNALACSNVHIARSEPKRTGSKTKAALPFDAYHILTIDVPGKAGDGAAATGGHRSPREHLRRGHIRRLTDGRRIWVNATVVAAGRGAGVVTKDYAVRCAA